MKIKVFKILATLFFIVAIISGTFLITMYNLKITNVTENEVEIEIFNQVYSYEYLKK